MKKFKFKVSYNIIVTAESENDAVELIEELELDGDGVEYVLDSFDVELLGEENET